MTPHLPIKAAWTLVLLSAFGLSSMFAVQSSVSPGLEVKSVEACRIELTPAGRQAAFAMTAVYRASVDSRGGITTLTPVLNVDRLTPFVRMAQFDACIKRWRFAKAGSYRVLLNAGTTGDSLSAWTITAGLDGSSVRVVLPRLD